MTRGYRHPSLLLVRVVCLILPFLSGCSSRPACTVTTPVPFTPLTLLMRGLPERETALIKRLSSDPPLVGLLREVQTWSETRDDIILMIAEFHGVYGAVAVCASPDLSTGTVLCVPSHAWGHRPESEVELLRSPTRTSELDATWFALEHVHWSKWRGYQTFRQDYETSPGLMCIVVRRHGVLRSKSVTYVVNSSDYEALLEAVANNVAKRGFWGQHEWYLAPRRVE